MRGITHFARWFAGLAQAETQTTASGRACLAKRAAGRRRLVEVGVWHGGTTRVLRAVMDPTATVWINAPARFAVLELTVSLALTGSEARPRLLLASFEGRTRASRQVIQAVISIAAQASAILAPRTCVEPR